MDGRITYQSGEVPWDLIAASFNGTLGLGEKAQLNQWLSLSPANLEKYRQWQRVWRKGLEDYEFYRREDARASWHSLRQRIGPVEVREAGVDQKAPVAGESPVVKETPVVGGNFIKKWINWVAAAIATGLVAGIGWWQYAAKTTVLYTTAANQQTTIALADGSAVTLRGATELKVDSDYNDRRRSVELIKGEVFFDVRHVAALPFEVRLGTTSVRDIGTSFTIEKEADSVRVTVQTGKVAFIDDATREQRELTGGQALSFYDREKRFGAVGTAFRDAPLGVVLLAIGRKYGKDIRLADTSLAKERITLQLTGESFDTAIGVICASMNLKLSQNNGILILGK